MSQPEPTPASSARPRPAWLMAVLPGVLVALVVGVFVSAFLWPLKASQPGNIAFGVAGPAEQVAQLTQQVTQQRPGLLDVTQFADRDQVVAAIEDRTITGGLVVGPTGVEMLTASAGNPQVAQLLTQMAQAMKDNAPAGVAVTTTDVVSGGTAAAASMLVMFPALIGGMATAMLAFVLVARPRDRVFTLLTGATLAGLVGAAVLGPWFDLLPGSFGMHWLALSVGVLAIGSTICGLATVAGRAGLGVGVALMMLVGNPWGGAMVPAEFLPGVMGWLGAHMPNGAVMSLMRNISYFPAASQSTQWWILVAWVALGLALLAVGAVRHARRAGAQAAPDAVTA